MLANKSPFLQSHCFRLQYYVYQQKIFNLLMYQSSTRAPTLHQWDIPDASSLPLPQEKRKITDACCLIIGLLFGLALLITAIVIRNGNNLPRTEFPTDSKGNICAIDAKDSKRVYPFLFFNQPSNPMGQRFCVQECPQQGVATSCFGGACETVYYPNYPSSEMGPLCLPQDDGLKYVLLQEAGLGKRFNREQAVNVLLAGVGIAFGVALLWAIIVQCLPKVAVWVAFILASVLLLVAAVLCFTQSGSTFSEDRGWVIFFGIIFVLFFILLVSYVCFHRKQVALCGCFMEVAADCLRQNLKAILHLLLFAALSFLFILLLIYEYLSFSSASEPTLKGLYYTVNCNGLLLFLLVMQGVWGFSFFRDANNYVISGIADEWYFHKMHMFCYPLKRLFTKNLGSVVGGSLLSALFYFPSLLISFLAPQIDSTLCNFFDLTRSDVYAYIYLTGNSYCPSSRQTQYLCLRSRICRQNQSTLALFTFAARFATAIIALLFTYWITSAKLVDSQVPILVMVGVFMACLYVSSYFSDVHAVVAQALMVCFLTESDLQEGWTYKDMPSCPQKLTKLITDVEGKGDYVKQWQ